MADSSTKRAKGIKKKQLLLAGGIGGIIVVIALGASALLQTPKKKPNEIAKPETKTLQVTTNDGERAEWRMQAGTELSGFGTELQKLRNDMQGLKDENKRLQDQMEKDKEKPQSTGLNPPTGPVAPPVMPPGLSGNQAGSMFSQVGTGGSVPPPPTRPDGSSAQPGMGKKGGMAGLSSGTMDNGSRIRSVSVTDEVTSEATTKEAKAAGLGPQTNSAQKFGRDARQKAGSASLSGNDGKERFADDDPLSINRAGGRTADTYLPTGTSIRVVMLNGLDAPTGGQSQQNPMPVNLLVDAPAQLPNGVKANLKGCFITGNGHGDLSAERAYIRLDRLSCIDEDGGAIDVAIRGYVSGEDGKTGVRGKVISKTGQVLANAILVGTLGGFGEGLRQSATQTNNMGALGQTTQIQNPWTYGMGSGVGKAMDRVAQYYIKLAEKLFPVIEVDGGRTVDVVLTRGVSIERQ